MVPESQSEKKAGVCHDGPSSFLRMLD